MHAFHICTTIKYKKAAITKLLRIFQHKFFIIFDYDNKNDGEKKRKRFPKSLKILYTCIANQTKIHSQFFFVIAGEIFLVQNSFTDFFTSFSRSNIFFENLFIYIT